MAAYITSIKQDMAKFGRQSLVENVEIFPGVFVFRDPTLDNGGWETIGVSLRETSIKLYNTMFDLVCLLMKQVIQPADATAYIFRSFLEFTHEYIFRRGYQYAASDKETGLDGVSRQKAKTAVCRSLRKDLLAGKTTMADEFERIFQIASSLNRGLYYRFGCNYSATYHVYKHTKDQMRFFQQCYLRNTKTFIADHTDISCDGSFEVPDKYVETEISIKDYFKLCNLLFEAVPANKISRNSYDNGKEEDLRIILEFNFFLFGTRRTRYLKTSYITD